MSLPKAIVARYYQENWLNQLCFDMTAIRQEDFANMQEATKCFLRSEQFQASTIMKNFCKRVTNRKITVIPVNEQTVAGEFPFILLDQHVSNLNEDEESRVRNN